MLLGKQRTQFSPKAIDTPAKCHRIRGVTVCTHFVLQKAVAQDAVDSQGTEIKPLRVDRALIPAHGALSIKKEGWLHPTGADSWTEGISRAVWEGNVSVNDTRFTKIMHLFFLLFSPFLLYRREVAAREAGGLSRSERRDCW